jgi:hypothetical protein
MSCAVANVGFGCGWAARPSNTADGSCSYIRLDSLIISVWSNTAKIASANNAVIPITVTEYRVEQNTFILQERLRTLM